MRRVPFTKEETDFGGLALYYLDVESSLRSYFNPSISSLRVRFAGYDESDFFRDLDARLTELDMTSSLTVLSALEGAFRVDYLQRCYQKRKDPISRAFRALHKRRETRVNLEDEILNVWKEHVSDAGGLIAELRGAFKYRHWLAHGRYWVPKLGKRYDFFSIYALASAVLMNFPLLRSG